MIHRTDDGALRWRDDGRLLNRGCMKVVSMIRSISFSRRSLGLLTFLTLVVCIALVIHPFGCTPTGGISPGGGNGGNNTAVDDCVAQADSETDSDADGHIDLCDNCPATANSEQADGDGNGLGDACDGGTASGFAVRTADGIVEIAFDGRGRPSLLVAGKQSAEFDWSDDATRVDVTIHDAPGSQKVILPVDLSDEALSALLTELENETGADYTTLREGLSDNPGLVAQVAAGLEPPPGNAKRSSGAASRVKIGPNLQAADISDTQLAMWGHLGPLWYKAMMLQDARHHLWDAYVQYREYFGLAEPDEETRQRELIAAAYDLEEEAFKTYDSQKGACEPCTTDCLRGCETIGTGACCTFQGSITSCLDDSTEQGCAESQGQYHPASFCAAFECGAAGACCTTIDCVDTEESDCASIPGGKFTPNVACADFNCADGACYTYYQSDRCPGGRCCCDCHPGLSDAACQVMPDFAYFARAEACPGACYQGSGIYGAYCTSGTESECVNDGGLFFHDSLCVGVCFFGDNGCEVITERECDERDGHVESYGVDSCAGACYLGDNRCVETVTRGDCVGGAFYLGEACP